MTREEFISDIRNEITISGAMPYDIPEKEYDRIISQAKSWFYINYRHAVEVQYYVIEKKWFSTPEFLKTKSILLPDCVVSVYECKEMKGGNRLGTPDKDFSANRLIAAELFLSPFQSDDLILRTAQYAYWDLTKAFILEHIQYEFNTNTKRIRITGRQPKTNVFLETYIAIEEEKLMDDWYFKRYCTCKAKESLARIINAFKYQLPGGIEVNGDLWKEEASTELESILTKIDEENVPDWWFITN
jgi:hypothetical protein